MDKTKADAKSCLFEALTYIYPEDLPKCETKEGQKWRNASATSVIHHINLFIPYIPELAIIKNYLELFNL